MELVEKLTLIGEQRRAPHVRQPAAIKRCELPEQIQQVVSLFTPYSTQLLVTSHKGFELSAGRTFREPGEQFQKRLRRLSRLHEIASHRETQIDVWAWHFKLYFEATPNGQIQKLRVVRDTYGETDGLTDIQVLEQSVYDTLDFTDFLGIVAKLRQRIKLVEEQQATITVRECEQIADISC
jgi:hypothetical protein